MRTPGVVAALALAACVLLVASLDGLRLLAYQQPIPDAADATFIGDAPDRAGDRLAVADVNGDGLHDLLIGAPLGTGVDGEPAGKVYLVLGRRGADWGDAFDLTRADASFEGAQRLAYTSYDLAGAGDVNGDGFDDFLVGAYRHTPSDTITNGGKVYLVLGRQAADWGIGFDLAHADASFDAEAAGDRLGQSVAGAGDVNGDGLADMLVGACSGAGVEPGAGRVYLLLGRRAADWGRDSGVDIADAAFLGENTDDFAGCALAGAGDVNGDGLADVLVGANGNTRNGDGTGTTYLILGHSGEWGGETSLADAASTLFVGHSRRERSGRAVAGVGDVNRDGLDDFLIGAPYNESTARRTGFAYLFFGQREPIWGDTLSLDHADVAFAGAHEGDEAGAAAAGAGDVNGDGFDDVLIGAPGFDASDVLTDSGRAYVILGRPSPWPASIALEGADSAGNMVALDGDGEDNALGTRLAGGGDVNGDRFADIVLGAPGYILNYNGRGKAHLVLGRGVALDKRPGSPQALPGAHLTYTLRYTNTNRVAVRDAHAIDDPPDGVSYVGCSGGVGCRLQGNRIVWNLGAVDVGGGTLELTVRVDTDVVVGTVLTNTAWITAPGLVTRVLDRALVRVGPDEPTPAATATPTSRSTPAPTSTQTPTPTRTATHIATHTATRTPTHAATRTSTRPPGPSMTPTSTQQSTRTPSASPGSTGTATATPEIVQTASPTPRFEARVYLPVAKRHH